MNSRYAVLTSALLALGATHSTVHAQQKVNPPIAQFWMDAATHSMSMPGMEEMGDMPLVGNLMGNAFGGARQGMAMPGKWLDSALHTRNKPAGTEGRHGIPEAMRMGASLPLLPVERQPASKGDPGERDEELQKPKGRLLFYWGCSETVRPGQPKVIDFAKAGAEDYGRFMTGRHAPDRGAKAVPGRSIWPNKENSKRVPKDASLVGEHAVSGEGVPENWRFAVGAGEDFMAKVRMSAAGDLLASVPVSWEAVATARGYFLTAMSGREDKDGTPEMILWSSSNDPDPGWGLMDYVTPARVDKLIKEKVVLPPETLKCAVPKGIFANTQGAMVRLIAYGPELNLAYPPRPTNPKLEWKPDWSVRLRQKSTGMAMLGQDAPSGAEQQRAQETPSVSDALKELPNPVNVLRGLFGK